MQRIIVFTVFLLLIVVVLWFAQQRLLPNDESGEKSPIAALLEPVQKN